MRNILLMIFICLIAVSAFGQEKGGIVPCLATCLIGPRVGLEMNEGSQVTQSELIALAGNLVGGGASAANPIGSMITVGTRAYMAYDMGFKKNNFEGFLASYCLGPRIGNEIDYRKIRTKEWMSLIPIVCIYPMISIPLEAYNGETMTEIEQKEGLRK